ncbi:MAG TPA: hypothetical protein VN894_03360 [Polyangiaceae bacterium]|nr:hypothetical protein [Polyangiaceae bacterium]
MRGWAMIVAVALGAGCASTPPPPAEVPASTSAQAVDDPNRRLTKSDCESLAATIVDACNNRGNDRSSEADGWCSEMLRQNEGAGTWIGSDCQPHFRYMDAFCMQGAKNAHAMMDCDKTVDRTR